MSAWCIGCKQPTDVVVLGDWYPPWALCPTCAARARESFEENPNG